MKFIVIFAFLSVLFVGIFFGMKNDYFKTMLSGVNTQGLIQRFRPFKIKAMPPIARMPHFKMPSRLATPDLSSTDLVNYIEYYMNKRKTEEQIRYWLLAQGWTIPIINKAFRSIYNRTANEPQLEIFISTYIAKGKSEEEIRKWLTGLGWGDKVVSVAFRNLEGKN